MGPFSPILLITAFFGLSVAQEKSLIVTTKQGKVEGKLAESGLYYEFLGIRYGVPIKFRAPAEAPSYPGVYKADSRNVICPQFASNDPLAAPSDTEDCLVANVFVPTGSRNASLAVMVFLHGGNFGVGSGSNSFYGPQYILSNDVLLVTINYRLNAYGFLNLGIKEAPGNAGLKDIRAALRWIKDNIKVFGGDPDNVTVFGETSGGTAAIYLTLSESTKGLFKRIISQSGSLFTPESFDPKPLATAIQLAKSLDTNTENPNDLLKVYSNTPVKTLEEAISKQMHAKSVFLPSVEKVFDGEEAFLTDIPYNIVSNKNHKSFHPVPMFIGQNSAEGIASTYEYITVTSQMDRIKNDDFSVIEPRSFSVPKAEKEKFLKTLKDAYLADVSTIENVVGGLINMNSDFSFVGPISLFTEIYTNNSDVDVFQYIFNYVGNRNLGRLLTNTSLPATTNRDELFYLFELERMPLPMSENDAKILTFMTMAWTNFAKFGKLTPKTKDGEWLPYPYNLAIALEPIFVSPLTPDRANFWRDLYLKYGAEIPK